MPQKTFSLPKDTHTLTPYLVVKGAEKAIEFYQKAFRATLLMRHDTPDGQVLHAKLQIGDSFFMLSDEFPQSSCGVCSPATLNGSTVMLHLYVQDVDSFFNQAIKAGATSKMAVEDTFWGDRYGQLTDPFGHMWSVATPKEAVSEVEVQKRAQKTFAGNT